MPTVKSTQINNTTIVNTIPGYPAEMVILKAYIYSKPWVNGEKADYLTLFSMVPINEYQKEVSMVDYKEWKMPCTYGVFINTIGSISGLITTKARIGLRTYQNHLEQVGWKFKETVPGVTGQSYETARKMAFAKIQQLKKPKQEITKSSFDKEEAVLLFEQIETHFNNCCECVPNSAYVYKEALAKLRKMMLQ